ncbi:MAG: NDP-hexose 2,3-dehydratase [Chloroflexi bacterium]|nr:NDP-hexose 2,3-dehydratase [Chloroflexota bacterium]
MGSSLKYNRFLRSALAEEGSFATTTDVLSWIASRAACNRFTVERIPFGALMQWSTDQDTGDLVHSSGKFFRVQGARVQTTLGYIRQWDQPIIDQPEIGILGIVAKEFDGLLHFLMQAKMEPGNIDGVQLTPTVQATRSNYTQVHQGARPPYVDYFLDREQSRVLVDQLQFEQGSAFLRKRNRNIIVEVTEDVPVGPEHCWLTVGQVHRLLGEPNLVSMDARTVLSCIPLVDGPHSHPPTAITEASGGLDLSSLSLFGSALLESVRESVQSVHRDERVMSWLTELKCRHQLSVERIGLNELRSWKRGPDVILHEGGGYFNVMAVQVEANNREVASWDQPLIEPVERGLIAFLVRRFGGTLHFLVQGKIEPGNPDVIAVAPTVQCSLGHDRLGDRGSWPPFLDVIQDENRDSVRYSCVQSEEGGRFFHVENEYRVVELPPEGDLPLPENYLWVSLRQLNELLRFGLVNVEARSLLACLPLTA